MPPPNVHDGRAIHPAGHWPPSGSGLQTGGAPPQLGCTHSSPLVHARAPHSAAPPVPPAPPLPPRPPSPPVVPPAPPLHIWPHPSVAASDVAPELSHADADATMARSASWAEPLIMTKSFSQFGGSQDTDAGAQSPEVKPMSQRWLLGAHIVSLLH